MKRRYLVKIKKLSIEVLDQWYAGRINPGEIHTVVETYEEGLLVDRRLIHTYYLPIPDTHYDIIKEL